MKRIGRFTVADGLDDRPEVRAILDRCDIIEKRYNPSYRCTEYVAYSPGFEPADMAGDPPIYNWMIYTRPDLSFIAEAVRYVPDSEIFARIDGLSNPKEDMMTFSESIKG